MIAIRFSADNSPLSHAVRCRTQGEWSHVEIVSQLNAGIAYGALPFEGVSLRRIPTDDRSITMTLNVPYPDWEWLRQQQNKPYDWQAVASIFLGSVHYWQNDNAWYCSELVAGFLQASGALTINPNYNRVITPMALEAMLLRKQYASH
jgi:hypothetical protein